MILYHKLFTVELFQSFDDQGRLLEQSLQVGSGYAQFAMVDIDVEEIRDIDSDDLPMKLEHEPELVKPATINEVHYKTYSILLDIVIQQLFDSDGKLLGQSLRGFDDFHGEPFGTVYEWDGSKMRSSTLEIDDNLPFPHLPLPFNYVLDCNLVQPKGLTATEKHFVEAFL